jgi:hypothetical protein
MFQLCGSADGPSIYDAAVQVREQSRLIGRPLAKRTVGSTLLLKGLEADVAVILKAEVMDHNHLYVAMTRGSRAPPLITVWLQVRVLPGPPYWVSVDVHEGPSSSAEVSKYALFPTAFRSLDVHGRPPFVC